MFGGRLSLQDVDTDGNGALDFQEFLVLMRRCDDIRDESESCSTLRACFQGSFYSHLFTINCS